MPEFASPYLILNVVLFAVGFYVLIKGSDLFIDAAAFIARLCNVPELIIGLTLVSIGTSLPEWASSVYAAVQGDHSFVIGNVVGSCTTNISLILGMAVVVGGGLSFPQKLLNRDALFMNVVFGLTLVAFFVASFLTQNQCRIANIISGIIFLCVALIYCYYLLKHPEALKEEIPEQHANIKSFGSMCKSFALLTLGFVLVFVGSKLLVDNVVWAANAIGIPTIITASTIVAFGTSLPELAVTLGGVLKGRNDIAIGNIIGSCIFNILLIFGTCAIITPLDVSGTEYVSLLLMMLSGIVLMITMWTHHKIVTWEGWILILIYAIFLVWTCWPILSPYVGGATSQSAPISMSVDSACTAISDSSMISLDS